MIVLSSGFLILAMFWKQSRKLFNLLDTELSRRLL